MAGAAKAITIRETAGNDDSHRVTAARLALFLACAGFLLFSMSFPCRLQAAGQAGDGPEVPRPEQVTNFDALYGANCAGCHGANGQWGASMSLANPEYQALVDDATIKDVIAMAKMAR